MRNKNTLGKTRLPLLPTSIMPSLAKVRKKKKKTTQNDHQKKEKIEPYTKIRIEQKALSGLQNCVQIYIHKRHDRFFPELFSVYQQMSCRHFQQLKLYMIHVIEL